MLSLVEDDARAGGVRACVDVARRLRGVGAGVNADAAEVVAETRLEELARAGIQRLPWTTERLVRGRRRGATALESAGRLRVQRLGFARGALVSDVPGLLLRVARGAPAPDALFVGRDRELRIGLAHDPVRDGVRLEFERIVGASDGQLRLNRRRGGRRQAPAVEHPTHGAVPDLPL